MDLKSAWYSTFFYNFFDLFNWKFLNFILALFCKLWSQTGTERLKKRKYEFCKCVLEFHYAHHRVYLFIFLINKFQICCTQVPILFLYYFTEYWIICERLLSAKHSNLKEFIFHWNYTNDCVLQTTAFSVFLWIPSNWKTRSKRILYRKLQYTRRYAPIQHFFFYKVKKRVLPVIRLWHRPQLYLSTVPI